MLTRFNTIKIASTTAAETKIIRIENQLTELYIIQKGIKKTSTPPTLQIPLYCLIEYFGFNFIQCC